MKALKVILGLATVGGFLYGVWYVKTNKVDLPFVPREKPVEVKEGTEIPLVLLTPLESGGSEEGKTVRFVVADDVKVGGRTVIEQGAIAEGRVARSRAGTLAGAMMNQPARLEVDLDSVKTADGGLVKVRAVAPGHPHEFTQANTKIDSKANVADALTDPQARELVVNAAKGLVSGKDVSDGDKTKADAQLKELAQRYGLESTKELLNDPKSKVKSAGDIAGVFESVQKGDFSSLAGVDLLLAAKAAGEIVELGSGIDKTLRGIFKGSNINARVGTPVTAYLAETKSIVPKPVK